MKKAYKKNVSLQLDAEFVETGKLEIVKKALGSKSLGELLQALITRYYFQMKNELPVVIEG